MSTLKITTISLRAKGITMVQEFPYKTEEDAIDKLLRLLAYHNEVEDKRKVKIDILDSKAATLITKNIVTLYEVI